MILFSASPMSHGEHAFLSMSFGLELLQGGRRRGMFCTKRNGYTLARLYYCKLTILAAR
jgi:hypothetical protein